MTTWRLSQRWRHLRMLYESKIRLPRIIESHFRRLAKLDTPILVGPWLSEVGFELLYWIPLLRRLCRRFEIPRERVVAISRGGAQPWYDEIAARYFDVFDFLSPAAFVAANSEREQSGGLKKQLRRSVLDEQVLYAATQHLNLGSHDVVHPSWMYNLFLSYWSGWNYLERALTWCDHDVLPAAMPRPTGIPFPGDYVAVKFYFSSCFPDVPDNRAFVLDVVRRLARTGPVVLLNTGIKVDDHDDAEPLRQENVFDAQPLMTPRNNLAVQTAIVAHARTLFSTYGGFGYLGPMLGKPGLAFYSEANFVPSHLQMAHAAFNRKGNRSLTIMPTHALTSALDLLCC